MLTLPVKKKWFEMILSGEKKEEYREIKPYYEKRLPVNFGYVFTDGPHGQEVSDGEYCSQTTLGEDWYVGKYYYPVENSDKYVGISYEI